MSDKKKSQSKSNHSKSNEPKKGALANLNHFVFWPPFLLLIAAVVLNLVSAEKFGAVTHAANDWVLENFGTFFLAVGLACLLLCIVICFLPFGKIRIGCRDAKPLMHMWNWFATTVCTTIAV